MIKFWHGANWNQTKDDIASQAMNIVFLVLQLCILDNGFCNKWNDEYYKTEEKTVEL